MKRVFLIYIGLMFTFFISAGFSNAAESLSTQAGLNSLSGVWEGRGTTIVSNDPESISCRGTSKPEGKKNQVKLTCYLSTGRATMVSYLEANDNTGVISGIFYQRFEGKQGEMKGKLRGKAAGNNQINLVLNAVGDDRASVVFKRIGENKLNLSIFDYGAQRVVFNVTFNRTALFK